MYAAMLTVEAVFRLRSVPALLALGGARTECVK